MVFELCARTLSPRETAPAPRPAGFGALALLFLHTPPRDLARPLESLRHYASQDLAVRRLEARRPHRIALLHSPGMGPPQAASRHARIAVFPDKEIPSRGRYLTIYHFAPLPPRWPRPRFRQAGWRSSTVP